MRENSYDNNKNNNSNKQKNIYINHKVILEKHNEVGKRCRI